MPLVVCRGGCIFRTNCHEKSHLHCSIVRARKRLPFELTKCFYRVHRTEHSHLLDRGCCVTPSSCRPSLSALTLASLSVSRRRSSVSIIWGWSAFLLPTVQSEGHASIAEVVMLPYFLTWGAQYHTRSISLLKPRNQSASPTAPMLVVLPCFKVAGHLRSSQGQKKLPQKANVQALTVR